MGIMATKLSAYLANATDEQIEEIRSIVEEFSSTGPVLKELTVPNEMVQEEKQLLLRDLCSRLPYGVKIKVRSNDIRTVRAVDMVEGIVHFVESDSISPFGVHIEHPTIFHQVVKPYLRPMSSMTEEEVKEIQKINWQFCKPNNVLLECFVGDADDGYCSISQMAGILDYLNAHHFDYRGLIPMGLALEAPEGMYEI